MLSWFTSIHSRVLSLLPSASTLLLIFFFFNDTATTEIYTLSLHDALPISPAHDRGRAMAGHGERVHRGGPRGRRGDARDRKSTRLNSSHTVISYAVFCLKKKKKKKKKTNKSIKYKLQRIVNKLITFTELKS